MGILGDVGKIIIGGALGGASGAISVFTVEHGGEVVEGTIDLAEPVVKIGEDVYRATPPEVFALGGDPIHGLLKHEFEDELVMVGNFAADTLIFAGSSWPLLGLIGVAGDLYVTGRALLGKVAHRTLLSEEWEMARYIFRDSLPDRDDIILTNLGGLNGRAFTFPFAPHGRPILVNLAGDYDPTSKIQNGPLLYHELTHAWQAKERILRELFFYDARVQITVGDPEAYLYKPGSQWSEYELEQQASIVEAWAWGATERTRARSVFCSRFDVGAREKFTINSPLFRYINGNVRRSDARAETSSGRSVRQLLAEGGHRTMKDMHSKPPPIWWTKPHPSC